MENEIKPMTKKELIRRIEEYKPKYIYQRYNGEIRQFEVVNDNYLVDTKSGMSFDFRSHLMLGKVSENLIDIIEDEDFCKIEFYSPRYEKRGTRIFEVSKIDEYITFENMHCDLFMINGEWSNNDKRLNPVIKEIYTKEMIESISYKVERKD